VNVFVVIFVVFICVLPRSLVAIRGLLLHDVTTEAASKRQSVNRRQSSLTAEKMFLNLHWRSKNVAGAVVLFCVIGAFVFLFYVC